jgi:hypothetical protein
VRLGRCRCDEIFSRAGAPCQGTVECLAQSYVGVSAKFGVLPAETFADSCEHRQNAVCGCSGYRLFDLSGRPARRAGTRACRQNVALVVGVLSLISVLIDPIKIT